VQQDLQHQYEAERASLQTELASLARREDELRHQHLTDAAELEARLTARFASQLEHDCGALERRLEGEMARALADAERAHQLAAREAEREAGRAAREAADVAHTDGQGRATAEAAGTIAGLRDEISGE
jgi:hypothetical protein